jgi:zinc/manganese transport system permease protein
MSTGAGDLLTLMWAPFLMCLVLTGIHAYLGIHVIAREVVFVDIALAQIAALGTAAALLLDLPIESPEAYAAGLGATLLGAVVLALTRSRERLLVDRAPHGAEHLRRMLVGSILAVTLPDVGRIAGLYALVGAFHWACRRPFFLISFDPDAAFRAGWRVRLWDFFFYASFGLVVTSSVRVAGVLLVFSYLIVPALAGLVLGGPVAMRLLVGWVFGAVVSLLGVLASALLDLPTGATVACMFGVTLLLWSGLARPWRRRGSLSPKVEHAR